MFKNLLKGFLSVAIKESPFDSLCRFSVETVLTLLLNVLLTRLTKYSVSCCLYSYHAAYQYSNHYFSSNEGAVCDEAEKACYCSYKGTTACIAVPNSSCDSETDSCKCNEDYYNNGGTCTPTPGWFDSIHGSIVH